MEIKNILFFEGADNFIKSLPDIDRAKVMANIKTMAIDFDAVNTRLLKRPIKELKVKKYRLLFFIEKNTIYVISGFVKKGQKTPLREIQKAKEIHKQHETFG